MENSPNRPDVKRLKGRNKSFSMRPTYKGIQARGIRWKRKISFCFAGNSLDPF